MRELLGLVGEQGLLASVVVGTLPWFAAAVGNDPQGAWEALLTLLRRLRGTL